MARSVCEQMSSFLAMQVLEKAQVIEAAGNRVIHLEVGQPDFATPECVNEAAIQAIRDNKTGYTHSMGILPLREAIAEYYDTHYGAKVNPEHIFVTNGTSPALMATFDIACEPGETVAMPTPTYACYENFVRHAGAEPLLIPAAEKEGFQLNPTKTKEALKPSTKSIILNSPSNPAGTVLARKTLQGLADLDLMLISDEIYHGLSYEERATSVLEITDNCCVLDGFSKRYAMTGWRLGWVVLPERLVPTMHCYNQNFYVCANSIAQWAGIAALKYAWPDVERMAAEYNKRRLVIVDGLRRLGFGVDSSPSGAFYVLADARHISNDSLALAFDILDKAHVGVTPGIDFGEAAEGYIRFSYANSIENIEEALDRLKIYLENR